MTIKRPSILACFLLITVSGLISGCINDKTFPVNQILQSQTCALEAGIIAVNNQEDLEKSLKNISANVLGQPPLPIPQTIDFEINSLFFVSLGNKPNTGYSLLLSSPEAQLIDGILYLPITTIEPNPEKFYPQIMASPCLLLSIPIKEYQDIKLANGKLRQTR